MPDPDKPHAYRRRDVTATSFPAGSLQAVRPAGAHEMAKIESENQCNVCGGSKFSPIHPARKS